MQCPCRILPGGEKTADFSDFSAIRRFSSQDLTPSRGRMRCSSLRVFSREKEAVMQEETSLTRPRRRDFMSGTAALAATFLSGFPFRRHPPPRPSPRSRALAITAP
jgi:hypothetical protein